MAKFGEQRTFTFSGVKKSFRLPVAEGNSDMYVNVGDNSIVKSQDMKLVHSWTITHQCSFTSPVVFNPEDELLYCVLDNQTLIKWSPNVDSLKKAPKIKFQESVFTVFIVPGGSPVILFNSCHIKQICDTDTNADPLELPTWNPIEKMIWAEAIHHNDILHIFCLGYFEKTKKFKLHSFKINEDSTVSSFFEQDILHSDFTLKSWCLNNSEKNVGDSTFFTLWSDGVILKHETFKSAHSELFSVSDVQNSPFFSMHMVDESHICIAKAVPKQKDCHIELWDFKFSACKAKRTIKSAAPINHIQLTVADSSVLLLLNEDLLSIPLHLERATLASVLGGSARDSSKILECSWNNERKVHIFSKETENCVSESMEVDSESMDGDCESSLKIIVEKFSKEGSNYFKYIPDTELVSLLRLALRCKAAASEKESHTRNADLVLNAVLSSSFNDVFMMNLLKKLSCEETQAILQVLLSLLKNPESDALAADSRPADFQVFSWTCLIIQSHMETLLFSKNKEIILLLKELNKCLIEKMEEYEDFERIRNFLLLSKNSFPKDNARKKYTIENLE